MGLVVKLATKHIDWTQIYIIKNTIIFAAAVIIYISQKPTITIGSPGFNYALAVDLISTIGTIAFYLAIQAGKAIIVIPLISLYPVITVVLSYPILHEEITLTMDLGIILALIAIVLISIQ